MRKSVLILSAAAFSFSLFLESCGNSEPEDVMDVDTSLTEDIDVDLFDESPEIDYHLPSPLQVASIFKKSGLEYNAGITNSVDNVDNYTDELKQMLNFGVYSADMAYCVLNEQANEGRKYLKVITELAGEIGMESVFENQDLMDRFDLNMENKDSIEILMIDIHERTEEFMEENNMQHNSAIHFAGAWTEGMYLGVYDYENNGQKDGLGAQMTEQMAILNNIIKGLKDPKNDGMELGWLVADLEKVQSTFDSFDSVVAYYEDETADELILNDTEYNQLGVLIKDLRAKIING
ncbi:hypothetical protein K6119_17195 [Paracrocinitomix mangrovi]|uniref:hypothetical protein n=1 Tax=Paracrocinitomix mangrovi TaxID=2862509 RepID=UPI001C8D87CF|nr:hypothetical protein [Paracrocinitomix mangrovi]UKN01463.1 hypothetical protein K6119_17195 [Paracrocinitomix mangrovi]